MRVAKLDMTNSSHQCPSGLMEMVYSNSDKRTCVRESISGGCSSVMLFPENFVNYTNVCGKIIGYQYGNPEAFQPYYSNKDVNVDGVILSHGGDRQHIWTFAAARDEMHSNIFHICPCTNQSLNFSSVPPSYAENDYFCDTGSDEVGEIITFYGDDPLWDGAGCGPTSTCCSFNTPPWFYKQLPEPTTDGIEMRVCRTAPSAEEDIAIEMIEIFVQ